MKIISKSEKETINLGKKISKRLVSGDIICLFGDLGTGKTTFVKGLAEGLKVKKGYVHSPSFVLMNVYDGKLPIYHFDLYRLDSMEEIMAIGYDEFIYGDGVAVIEWAEKMGELLPQSSLGIRIKHKQENAREFNFSSRSDKHKRILKDI